MLVVEGLDDQHFIWNLCQKIDFKPEFEVKEMGGDKEALNYFSTDIKNQKQPFGLILDADQDIESRKKEIVSKLARYFEIPKDEDWSKGLIIQPEGKAKFGIWLWPDCQSNGILEDLFLEIISKEDKLSPFAQQTIEDLKNIEEYRFKPQYKSKAVVHTWLAWQTNPGAPLGSSVKRSSIDHNHPTIQKFTNWLQRLYTHD